MIKSFLLGVITLIAILGIVSISLPRQIHLQRDILINAPAELAYDELSDVKNWPKWLPGHYIDSGLSLDFAGPPVGARYNLKSQRRGVGQGVMTIVSAEPPKKLVTDLDFGHEDKAQSTFTLEETEEGTLLTWHFDKYMGDNPFRKFSGLLIDSTVGEEFEDGLENIKREVEAKYVVNK